MFYIGISLSPEKSGFEPILYSGNLDKGMEVASNLGYDGVELSLIDSDKIDRVTLKNKLRKLNLKVYAIATGQSYYTDGFSLFSSKEDKRDMAVNRIASHIDLAADLGCKVIIGGIRGKIDEKENGKLGQIEKGKSALIRCLKYAERAEVILLLEPINRYETNVINNLEEAVKLIEEMGSDNLKLLPDTFHMNIEESDICQSLSKVKSYIGYIHLADSNRHAPGRGHIDFKKIFAVLEDINYVGPIGVEILPLPDDYQAAKSAITYIRSLIGNNLNSGK